MYYEGAYAGAYAVVKYLLREAELLDATAAFATSEHDALRERAAAAALKDAAKTVESLLAGLYPLTPHAVQLVLEVDQA